MEAELVDVYVCGDGGTWSHAPSSHYELPTDLFNHYMMLGRLNDKSDLEDLVEKVKADGIQLSEATGITNIWVNEDNDWSGVPPIHFQIPNDVFDYIMQTDREKLFGRLRFTEHLQALIIQTRHEIATYTITPEETITERTKPPNIEIKACGHTCTVSDINTTGCCACLDQRAMQAEGTYEMYVDGIGYVNQANRNASYCPYCICL